MEQVRWHSPKSDLVVPWVHEALSQLGEVITVGPALLCNKVLFCKGKTFFFTFFRVVDMYKVTGRSVAQVYTSPQYEVLQRCRGAALGKFL